MDHRDEDEPTSGMAMCPQQNSDPPFGLGSRSLLWFSHTRRLPTSVALFRCMPECTSRSWPTLALTPAQAQIHPLLHDLPRFPQHSPEDLGNEDEMDDLVDFVRVERRVESELVVSL
jgi:hypothetical protein